MLDCPEQTHTSPSITSVSYTHLDVYKRQSYKSLRLTARNLGYMTYIGFPALLSALAISCLMVVGNYTFIRYTGKDGVAAVSYTHLRRTPAPVRCRQSSKGPT